MKEWILSQLFNAWVFIMLALLGLEVLCLKARIAALEALAEGAQSSTPNAQQGTENGEG